MTGGLVVQFYVFRNVHWPMFEALFEYLGTRPEVRERVLCLPSIERLKNGDSHALLRRLLDLGVRVTAHPADAGADVTFIADTVGGHVRGCGLVVNVGHGTISKGYYFTDGIWTERENWVDLLCVPGDYAAERFRAILRTRVVPTGMPKLDPVFGGRHTREALCRQYGIAGTDRILLYAPTFNEDLSSVYLFAERFAELAQPGRTVLIKLHGSTKSATVDAYRALAAATPGLVFVEDPNIAPALGGADVMLSDVSSVFMEFMALDKPVILFDNPRMTSYHGYHAEDIEHAWRDLATRVTSFDDARAAIDRVMGDGDDGRSAIRRGYAARLFADRDGRACERVWTAVQETLAAAGPAATRPPRVPMLTVLLVLTPAHLFLVRRLVSQIAFFAVLPVELHVVVQGSAPDVERFLDVITAFPPVLRVRVTRTAAAAETDAALATASREAEGDYVAFLRPNVVVHRGFDYFLHKTFAAHPEARALTPVWPLAGDAHRRHFEQAPLGGVPDERAAYQFLNWHRGETIAPFTADAPPPGVVFRKALAAKLPAPLSTGLTALARSGRMHVAASVFCSILPAPVIEQASAFLASRGAARAAQAVEILGGVSFLIFPDVAEALLGELVRSRATALELEPIIGMAMAGRSKDLLTLRTIRAAVKMHPALTRRIDEQLDVSARYVSACRRTGGDALVAKSE